VLPQDSASALCSASVASSQGPSKPARSSLKRGHLFVVDHHRRSQPPTPRAARVDFSSGVPIVRIMKATHHARLAGARPHIESTHRGLDNHGHSHGQVTGDGRRNKTHPSSMELAWTSAQAKGTTPRVAAHPRSEGRHNAAVYGGATASISPFAERLGPLGRQIRLAATHAICNRCWPMRRGIAKACGLACRATGRPLRARRVIRRSLAHVS